MEFDDDHKVIPETLTRDEAREFIYWLLDEIMRHGDCIAQAESQKAARPAIYLILESACIRHREDIKGIEEVIRKVRGMYRL